MKYPDSKEVSKSLRAFKYFRDPKAMELVASSTRRKILYLLRTRELTVSQIAEQLSLTPQAVYHHIRLLLKAGMVEVAREERMANFVETYYIASAEVFEFTYGKEDKHGYAEQEVSTALKALPKLGIKVKVNEKQVARLVDVMGKTFIIGTTPEMDETIAKLDGVGFNAKQHIALMIRFLHMSDAEFQTWINTNHEFRELLQSMVQGKT